MSVADLAATGPLLASPRRVVGSLMLFHVFIIRVEGSSASVASSLCDGQVQLLPSLKRLPGKAVLLRRLSRLAGDYGEQSRVAPSKSQAPLRASASVVSWPPSQDSLVLGSKKHL